MLHMTFLRQFNALISKEYGELIKDSPTAGGARIYGLCTLLPGGLPQAYPQGLWISGKTLLKQLPADHC
ncbi:hypothetical protein [Tahibacter caeni]|uniref:hypothetical protein n=1 Tax=Tahibacter caeni TaxID=1453545 RepID=UPI0021489CCA|nr:hypothetical protein [Tahibacter caeni]